MTNNHKHQFVTADYNSMASNDFRCDLGVITVGRANGCNAAQVPNNCYDFQLYNDLNSGKTNMGQIYACRVGSAGSTQCIEDFAGSADGFTVTRFEMWN